MESATEKPCCAGSIAPLPCSLPPSWLQVLPERVNIHAAPSKEASPGPPSINVLPSPESPTQLPCSRKVPVLPVPISLPPCWFQVPPERVNTHVAPKLLLSPGPPSTSVFPSLETATVVPCPAVPTAALPSSSAPCWVHTPPDCVKTNTPPLPPLSDGAPAINVLPSVESATKVPTPAPAPAPLATSLLPSWVQTPPERVKIHTAP